MEYIATAALVVIALCALSAAMDAQRIRQQLFALSIQLGCPLSVCLSDADRLLLSTPRRRKPSVKENMHSANNLLGRTESL